MPHPRKEKPFDALRSQLTYANEQTAIWRNKAKAEEDRAATLEKLLAEEKRVSGVIAIRLDLAENKAARLREERDTRDQTIVQTAIRLAWYGDPELLPAAGVRTTATERG